MSSSEKGLATQEEILTAELPISPGEPEEFSDLLDSYSQPSHRGTGTRLHGRVVRITDAEVIVDVGYKCEGSVPLDEFRDDWGNVRVQPADKIEVVLESSE